MEHIGKEERLESPDLSTVTTAFSGKQDRWLHGDQFEWVDDMSLEWFKALAQCEKRSPVRRETALVAKHRAQRLKCLTW